MAEAITGFKLIWRPGHIAKGVGGDVHVSELLALELSFSPVPELLT